jgi:hypothetical protein
MPEFVTQESDATAPPSPEVDAARLAILKDLERGAIDIETATEQLMAIERV